MSAAECFFQLVRLLHALQLPAHWVQASMGSAVMPLSTAAILCQQCSATNTLQSMSINTSGQPSMTSSALDSVSST